MGMAEDPLNVGERHVGITGHPVGRGVSQVMQRPVGSQCSIRAADKSLGFTEFDGKIVYRVDSGTA